MTPSTRNRLIVLTTAAITFFSGLGMTRLWDEDEGFFAATASEMHRKDEWIVPWYNGEIFAHKPPLMYWGMRLGFYALGENEWGARIGSAIFGAAAALLTQWIGCRLVSSRVGLLGGLAMASCLMFGVVSRASTADAYLVFFMTLVMAAYIRWTPFFSATERTSDSPEESQSENNELSRLLPSSGFAFMAVYAAMGLAVLVKGPIGILLPGTSIGLFVLWQLSHKEVTWKGRLHRFLVSIPAVFWRMRPLTAIATVTVVSGWWFAAVEARTGGNFLGEFLGFHNVQRFLTPMEKHSGPIIYYLPVVWIGFFPWSLFIIPAAITLTRRLRGHDIAVNDREVAVWRLVFCWFGVIFAFFSVAQTKLPNYVLPCYPPLSLIVAGFLSRWLVEPVDQLRFWSRWAFGSLAIIGGLLLVLIPAASLIKINGVPLLTQVDLNPEIASQLWPVGLIGLPALVGGIICWRAAERGQPVRLLGTFAVTSVVFCLAVLWGAAAYLDRFQSNEALADTAHTRMPASGTQLASYRLNSPSLIYYARQPVVRLSRPEQIQEFMTPQAVLIVPEAGWSSLPNELRESLQIVGQQPRFPKPGAVLIVQKRLETNNQTPQVAETGLGETR